MRFLNIINSSIFQILSLISLLVYFLGVFNLHFSDKNDYCVMTYMFEYPQFVRISLEENKLYPQYGLYAYSEGRFTERARKMWFDGIPVLFLPGNSGSHMQARSIASVALRKAIAKGYEYHFDFFTISYNEELSGLYGGVLEKQTDFAAACILKILSLYKSNKYTKTVPTSVVLIGHSMGGLIAKRLLVYHSTINATEISITLAAPVKAPIANFDTAFNNYYMLMNADWAEYNKKVASDNRKILISIGSGPRDLLVPAALTKDNNSFISTLATSIPGVWVSPDHVSMVWCKQLVLVINRYLFDIVDTQSEQISNNRQLLTSKALQYFQANHSMTVNPAIKRPDVILPADAFWYEDNRRIYQINRPDIDKTAFLMIRLVSFPQNRFVAIESVNVDDKDWIFGCNAKYTYGTYRHCKQATSLTELSRWSGAANDFGRRKLATIDLHSIMDAYTDWSHVVVKVSPTKKPITLNVDINDHASRRLDVNLPLFGRQQITQETQANALYYELILGEMNAIHQAYLLHVEPVACQNGHYHVTAEMHVPWANNEYHHYFTHLKRSPMKLRLFNSNPNITMGLEPVEKAKVTLLLDPKCTFSISISGSWYHRLAQIARNYTPTLVPYVAAILLLAARSSMINMEEKGTWLSIHGALMCDSVKPYYILVFARLGSMLILSVPFISYLVENASWNNLELHYFANSLLVLPTYMAALGIVNVSAAAILAVMLFWSQLAHRLLFRIMWRGGGGLAEKVASGLQKVPMVVSVCLVFTALIACGAASLVAGAAFYAFMLSKMYEDYLEDYVYKLMAKLGSRICRIFKSKRNDGQNVNPVPTESLEGSKEIIPSTKEKDSRPNASNTNDKSSENISSDAKTCRSSVAKNTPKKSKHKHRVNDAENNAAGDIDQDLNNLNFHVMMFFLWLVVAIVNIPALLTWARNFKYSVALKPDTSFHTGFAMSVCSVFVWQMDGPKRNLKHFETLSSIIHLMALFILVIGISILPIVNYGVTIIFVLITMQQEWDFKERDGDSSDVSNVEDIVDQKPQEINENSNDKKKCNTQQSEESSNDNNTEDNGNEKSSGNIKEETTEDCDVCSESRIYKVFKNLREKFSFNNEV